MKARRIRRSSKRQVVVPVVSDVAVSVDALIGCIPYRGPKHTVAEMEQVVLGQARRRGSR